MSKNDLNLLRFLIREMVNEAPYRSSQRVTLGGVQWSGTPDIKATLIAGGMVGLIKLYDWATGLCTVEDENNNFPIKFSKQISDKIAKLRAWSSDEYQKYKDSIAVTPTSTGKSDRENLTKFHVLIRDAGTLWPKDYPDLGSLSSDSEKAILAKMKEILAMYSGCSAVTLDTVPTPTRKEYREFLINIGDLAENNFESNLFDQMSNMTGTFPGQKEVIEKEVKGSMTASKGFWTQIRQTLQ